MRLRQFVRSSLLASPRGRIRLRDLFPIGPEPAGKWRLTRSLISSLKSTNRLERRDAAVELGAMRLRGEDVSEDVLTH